MPQAESPFLLMFFLLVIPAKAGIQLLARFASSRLRRAGYFLALPKK